MKKIFLVVMLAFVTSCSVASSPTAVSVSISTRSPLVTTEFMHQASWINTPTFTFTLPPSQTQTPSQTTFPTPTSSQTIAAVTTPFPPLNAKGPYLVFANMPSPFVNFVVLNPDGSGQKVIPFPQEPTYLNGFSPNGEWGVLVSNIYEPGDISLSLLHIPDGEIQVISLLSSQKSAGKYPLGDCPTPFGLFRQTAWSPDGRYLAFAANTAGTSFDLFTYDTKSGALHRLTNDSADILSIGWSPDSTSIYYLNGIQPNESGDYDTYTVNITRPANQPNQGIQTILTTSDGLKWSKLVEQKFLITLSADRLGCNAGGPSYAQRISAVNIATGENTKIWSGVIYSVAIDPRDEAVLLFGYDDQSDRPLGFYILSFEGRLISTLDGGPSESDFKGMIYRGGPKYAFIINGKNDLGVLGVTLGGKMEKISERNNAEVDLSPNNGWFVISNDQGVDLFSKDDRMVDSLDQIAAVSRLWEPGGHGLYFETIEEEINVSLYYWSFSEHKTHLIKKCPYSESDCGFYDLSWVS